MAPEYSLERKGLASLAKLISTIGLPNFEDEFLTLFREAVRANHLAAFLVDSNNELQNWRVFDADNPRETISVTRHFMSHFWAMDCRLFLDGAERSQPGRVQRRKACDIDNSEYRELCYIRPGVIDRLLVSAEMGSNTLHLCAYRSNTSRFFTDSEIEIAGELAPTTLAALGRHLSLIGCRSLGQTTHHGDEETLLSGRERQVADLVASGYTSKEIAGTLKISQHTVLTYRKRIYEKLEIGSQRDLLARRYKLAS